MAKRKNNKKRSSAAGSVNKRSWQPLFITFFFTATVIFYIFLYALEKEDGKVTALDRVVTSENVKFKYQGENKINYYKEEEQQLITDQEGNVSGSETLVDFFKKHEASFAFKKNSKQILRNKYRKKYKKFYGFIRNLNQKKYIAAYKFFKKLSRQERRALLEYEFTSQKSSPVFLVNLALFTGSFYGPRRIGFLKDLVNKAVNKTVVYYLSEAVYRLEHPEELDMEKVKAYFEPPETVVRSD
ncbi:MAG TPA: hypothetical protein VKS21_02800 [Spirochaetota bacterium]|nr:hypothetical protein [Spirochaetota bacterium]